MLSQIQRKTKEAAVVSAASYLFNSTRSPVLVDAQIEMLHLLFARINQFYVL